MQSHEYKVVPAPRRGLRARGLRRDQDRFAHAIESEMNRMAAEGWEFVRSDTLPREHRAHWFARPVTVFETLLVFRRAPASEARRGASHAMPPPVALTPPAFVAEEPRLGAASRLPEEPRVPAASRFTPPPLAPLPANDTAPAVAPPSPTLTVVEGARPIDPPEAPSARHAAE